MLYQVTYQAEHPVAQVVLGATVNNRNRIHEVIVAVVQCQMDVAVRAVEADATTRTDRIGAITIITIQMIAVRMVILMKKHQRRQLRGRAVIIMHEAVRLEIASDLSTIGK